MPTGGGAGVEWFADVSQASRVAHTHGVVRLTPAAGQGRSTEAVDSFAPDSRSSTVPTCEAGWSNPVQETYSGHCRHAEAQ